MDGLANRSIGRSINQSINSKTGIFSSGIRIEVGSGLFEAGGR